MNYKESTLSGSQWQRCVRVTIDNNYKQVPQVTFHEERITLAGDKTFQENVGAVYATFDPNAEIALLDPETGVPLGTTMTQGQVYLAMWSLYMAKAKERDERGPVFP